MLPTVPSSEGRKNFLEVVPVIAEIPLVLPSSEGRGKLGTIGTTVWFTVEYCHSVIFDTSEANQFRGPSLPWELKERDTRSTHYILDFQVSHFWL